MTYAMDEEHTLLEAGKSIGADGNDLAIIDTISKHNPMLEEGYWMEADDFNSHHILTVLSEPTGSDSVINKGTPWEAVTTKPVTEPLQGLRSWSRIDTRILDKKKNPEKYRSDRNRQHVKGMAKTFHTRSLYGNHDIYPDQISGLITRVDDLSTHPESVYNGSASGGMSILVVKWGPGGVYFTYPRNGQNFIRERDMKERIVYDSDNLPWTAVVSLFEINFGLCVEDYRNFQRYCNIAVTGDTNIFDDDKLIAVLNQMEDLDNAVIYVNKTAKTQMDQNANNKTNVNYTVENVWGRPTTMFQQVPVRRLDSLLTTESTVS